MPEITVPLGCRAVTFADGKYTFIRDELGTIITVYRYTEQWPAGIEAFAGSKAMMVVLDEVEELRAERAAEGMTADEAYFAGYASDPD